ncbi:acyl carrier protein [Kitasatospora mediocidica]|uniref:acyl carrier protein n=1 Tax=Kitasatospora mediocidica TaxID=58352 RepID=UPI001E467BFA|nr:acyl carrier protein [Kitasatospora mediocidica]
MTNPAIAPLDLEVPDLAPLDPELRHRVVTGIALLLPRVLKRDVPPLSEEAGLFDELGLTSSSTLELILELEDSLEIQIDVEQITQGDLRTVATLADFVAGHTLEES